MEPLKWMWGSHIFFSFLSRKRVNWQLFYWEITFQTRCSVFVSNFELVWLSVPKYLLYFFAPTAVDCIKIAIQNLFKLADTLPACDVCEAASIVLCFVKDSYPISSALLTEFENNDGYQLLLKILLR